MEFLKSLGPWLMENYVQLFTVVAAGLAFAEALVIMTPTKTDDGAVKRIGSLLDKTRELLKIPNNVKKDELPK